ncbi:hypothetical protein HDU93_001830 [Gonapodya sp. JEL0774]|nr:hypothetical protein HDU93_001830 [Gonapodya sp. JEL0774]
MDELEDTLHPDYHGYLTIIKHCAGFLEGIGYLTIDERLVPVGEHHRRPGLHIESPTLWKESPVNELGKANSKFHPVPIDWGCGIKDLASRKKVEGIFFGSNVDGTSCVYPNVVLCPAMADSLGSIEGYRHLLDTKPVVMRENEIYWITDKTPHESLPVRVRGNRNPKPVYRQFFRLVTGKIDVWYSKHNTPNTYGNVLPDCRISHEDKFQRATEAVGGRVVIESEPNPMAQRSAN